MTHFLACRSMWPRGQQNVQHIGYFAITGQMRGFLAKVGVWPISQRVGHTDLGLGMEVKVTYRYESYELKKLHKQRNMPPFIG